MEDARDWVRHADEWLDTDYRLLTDEAGWRLVREREDLRIWSRRMPDDKNRLFRWQLTALEASAEVVFEGFVRRLLDHHQHWTKEYVDGRVVDELDAGARVLYQRFDPGVPGISKRDLCSAEVHRELVGGALLASYRSVDGVPRERGYERIDWWGAALCTPRDDGRSCDLSYLDRENQGGLFPAWLMNLMMPRYLVKQGVAVRAFFGGGGPPS